MFPSTHGFHSNLWDLAPALNLPTLWLRHLPLLWNVSTPCPPAASPLKLCCARDFSEDEEDSLVPHTGRVVAAISCCALYLGNSTLATSLSIPPWPAPATAVLHVGQMLCSDHTSMATSAQWERFQVPGIALPSSSFVILSPQGNSFRLRTGWLAAPRSTMPLCSFF